MAIFPKNELCKRFNKLHSLLYDDVTNRTLTFPACIIKSRSKRKNSTRMGLFC